MIAAACQCSYWNSKNDMQSSLSSDGGGGGGETLIIYYYDYNSQSINQYQYHPATVLPLPLALGWSILQARLLIICYSTSRLVAATARHHANGAAKGRPAMHASRGCCRRSSCVALRLALIYGVAARAAPAGSSGSCRHQQAAMTLTARLLEASRRRLLGCSAGAPLPRPARRPTQGRSGPCCARRSTAFATSPPSCRRPTRPPGAC